MKNMHTVRLQIMENSLAQNCTTVRDKNIERSEEHKFYLESRIFNAIDTHEQVVENLVYYKKEVKQTSYRDQRYGLQPKDGTLKPKKTFYLMKCTGTTRAGNAHCSKTFKDLFHV